MAEKSKLTDAALAAATAGTASMPAVGVKEKGSNGEDLVR